MKKGRKSSKFDKLPENFIPPYEKKGVHSLKPPKESVDCDEAYHSSFASMLLGLQSEYHYRYLEEYLRLNGQYVPSPVSIVSGWHP